MSTPRPVAAALPRVLVALLLASTSATPPAGAAAQGPAGRVPTFRSDVALVRVSVVVRDKNGNPIRGLKREDFTLLEDGKPQPILAFDVEEVPSEPASPTEPPIVETATLLSPKTPAAGTAAGAPASPAVELAGRRLIVLLFDADAMEPEQLERAIASARVHVQKGMSAADLVAVASIGTGLEIEQDFTSDHEALRRALDRLAGAESGAPEADAEAPDATAGEEADEPMAPDTTELALFNIDRRLRAIRQLADALAPVRQKKSVVFYSGGVSGLGTDNQVELRAAIDRAVRANLSIYPVDARGLEASVPGGEARQASTRGTDAYSGRAMSRQLEQRLTSQDTLSALATDTGGRGFFDSNDLGQVHAQVVADTSSYYVLGYSSSNGAKDGRFRRLKVRVRRSDVRVEHRSGYYAERDFVHARREDREQQLTEQLLSDLSATDLPVWVQTAHFRVAETRFYVPLSVAIPGAVLAMQAAADKPRLSLDLIAVVRDEARRAVARVRDTIRIEDETAGALRRKNVQYQSGFTLPPGIFHLKLVVRENGSGTFGSFETEVRVPDLRKRPIRTSSVVIGTQLQPARGRSASPLVRDGSELVPSVTHVVDAHRPIYFYYEVYEPGRGPGGDVHLSTNIAFFRGRVRRYETPLVEMRRLAQPDRGAAVFQFSVPPGSLQPGYYVCQVNVIDDVSGSFVFPRLALLVR